MSATNQSEPGDGPEPVAIQGEILLSDGSRTQFQILDASTYRQWGNPDDQYGCTVDLLESLVQASGTHLCSLEGGTR